MTTQPELQKLPMKLRIMIGIAGLPSLVLAGMLCVMVINGQHQDIGAFELVYSFVGFFAAYLAITGKRIF